MAVTGECHGSAWQLGNCHQKQRNTEPKLLRALSKARDHAIRMVRFPIRDRSVPTPEQMRSILQCVQKELDAGGIVYIHCLGGIGRTGTVMGCYFVEQGHADPLELLQALTASEPEYFRPTPQTEEQRHFVLDWKPNDGSGSVDQ